MSASLSSLHELYTWGPSPVLGLMSVGQGWKPVGQPVIHILLGWVKGTAEVREIVQQYVALPPPPSPAGLCTDFVSCRQVPGDGVYNVDTGCTYGFLGPKMKNEEALGMGGAALGDSSSSTATMASFSTPSSSKANSSSSSRYIWILMSSSWKIIPRISNISC